MGAAALAKPLPGSARSALRRGLGGGGRPGARFTRALRRRDQSVLDEVYGEYAGTVLGYLINALGDRGAAEDVHQQVFLEVWQRAPSYDP